MEYTKADLNWLMNALETRSERYMEAEDMLLEVLQMPWYKRWMINRKILKFLSNRSHKYNF